MSSFLRRANDLHLGPNDVRRNARLAGILLLIAGPPWLLLLLALPHMRFDPKGFPLGGHVVNDVGALSAVVGFLTLPLLALGLIASVVTCVTWALWRRRGLLR
jgi:hypothetical protein